MRVLGIDPGTIQMGYGVIEAEGVALSYVDCGVIKAPSDMPIARRLHKLYLELKDIISDARPDVAAVETPFVAKNVNSAIAIGQAQAIAILAAAEASLPVYQYAPAKVKSAVTNYGASSKEQVQQMVRLQLGLRETLPHVGAGSAFRHLLDATDALAVAICHSQQLRLGSILAEQKR